MKLTISYDPYLLEASFLVDDIPVNGGWAEYPSKHRLQSWFYPAHNWPGFAEALAGSLNESCDVEFAGRKLDYEDLRLYFGEWNRREDQWVKFYLLPHERVLVEDKEVLTKLDALVETFQDSPVEAMRDPRLMERYQEAHSADFDIAVIATMSSGKSTLINALLGQDLLPTANDATTAKISRIRDVDGTEGFRVSCRNKDEQLIHEETTATPQLLQEYNEDKEVFYVDLEGKIPGISNRTLRLNLIDTPGPNNSATEEHRNVTYSIINDTEQQPIILYVLDATKPEDESDANLLRYIAAQIKDGGRQTQERFIFAMNKADDLEEKNDGTVSDVIRRRQNYLCKPDIGIEGAQIIPICARAAKFLQMRHNGQELSRKEMRALEYALESPLDKDAQLTPSCRKKLDSMKQEAQEKCDQYTLDLIATGIVGLELTINEYLEKYAYPYKISRIVSTFSQRLKEEWDTQKYVEHIAQGEEMREKAEEQLMEAYRKKGDLEAEKKELEQMTNDVSYDPEMLRRLRLNLSNKLVNVLNLFRSETELTPGRMGAFLNQIRNGQRKILEDSQRTIRQDLKTRLKMDFEPVHNNCRNLLEQIKDIRIMDISFENLEEVCSMEGVLESMARLDFDMIHDESMLFEKTHTESSKKKNPAREGFLGFFRVWKPWNINNEVIVSDGMYVKTEELYNKLSEEMNQSLQDLFKRIESQIQQIYMYEKQKCQAVLTRLDDCVTEKLTDIQKLAKELEENKIDLDLNYKRKDWIERMQEKLDALTQFQKNSTSNQG